MQPQYLNNHSYWKRSTVSFLEIASRISTEVQLTGDITIQMFVLECLWSQNEKAMQNQQQNLEKAELITRKWQKARHQVDSSYIQIAPN